MREFQRGPRTESGGTQAGDVAHFPRKVWGRVVVKKRNQARSQASFPAWTLILDPSGPEPSGLGRPPALASVYRVLRPRSLLHAPLCVLQKDAQFGRSPARPASRRARPRPPTNALRRTPHGAGPQTEGRAADAPRHVHKGRLGARGSASPLRRPGRSGRRGREELQLPTGFGGVIPHNFQIF